MSNLEPFLLHACMEEIELILACVTSVSVGLGSKESQRNWIFGVLHAGSKDKRGKRGEGEGGFRAGKTPKIPSHGLSLLPKPLGNTLDTQAKLISNLNSCYLQ